MLLLLLWGVVQCDDITAQHQETNGEQPQEQEGEKKKKNDPNQELLFFFRFSSWHLALSFTICYPDTPNGYLTPPCAFCWGKYGE
jgi:hypothetical protein